jgi:hypothetical protein
MVVAGSLIAGCEDANVEVCVQTHPNSSAVPLEYARPQARALPPWAAALGTPLGWPMLLIAGVITIGTFNVYRNGGVPFMDDFGVIVAWFVFLSVVAARVFARVLMMVVPAWRSLVRGRWFDYCVAAILLLALANWYGVKQRWPLHIGFWLSRGELNRYAASVRFSAPLPNTVGLYDVQKFVPITGGGFRIETGYVGFIDPDPIGFEYAPSGIPTQRQAIDLGGGWFWW